MSAEETIKKHADLIKLILEHQYVPQASAQNWGELVNAYKQITGNTAYCESCSGSMMEIARFCKQYIDPKFYSFPKQ